MNQSENINELAKALSQAQGQIKGAIKDSKNPFFKSNYADLSSVWDACREALTKNGLSVIQTTDYFKDVAELAVITTLAHSSGQWVKGILPIHAKTKDPQGTGSAITYARRYALAAIVGVVQVDDDAEAAMGKRGPAYIPPMKEDTEAHQNGITIQEYTIPYGPCAKQTITKADPVKLRQYILEIEEKASKTGKPLPEWATILIKHAEPIIASFENFT